MIGMSPSIAWICLSIKNNDNYYYTWEMSPQIVFFLNAA